METNKKFIMYAGTIVLTSIVTILAQKTRFFIRKEMKNIFKENKK